MNEKLPTELLHYIETLPEFEIQKQIGDFNQEIKDLKQQISDSSKNTTREYTSLKGVKIFAYNPLTDDTIETGVSVVGSVPGSWSFEASFPVKLLNSQGDTVAEGTAKLLDDWMTDNQVLFAAKLEWSSKQSGGGELILQKDSPSGLDANNDHISIPIKF